MLRSSEIPRAAEVARTRFDELPGELAAPLRIFLATVVVLGVIARLTPLSNPGDRLFWQYVTEDGYLLQTVARNMAIGLGMSTAEGTIPTNGVQPLATFLYAGLHFIASGSKLTGIVLLTIFSTLVSVLAAYLFFKVAHRVFRHLRNGRALAMASSALWFVAPHSIAHSMNGLETGVYYAMILLTLNYYMAISSNEAETITSSERLILGLLLGFTFLARNDAIFFIGGLLLAHLLIGDSRANLRRSLDCFCAAGVSLLVAAPWLIYNKYNFGSIVPISGISQSHAAHLGQNLSRIPANLFESATLFLLVPGVLESTILVSLISMAAVILIIVGFWYFTANASLVSQRFYVSGLIFVTATSIYYGVFFGAPHFISRYLSPLSIFLWIATCGAFLFLLSLLFRNPLWYKSIAISISGILSSGAFAFAYADFNRGFTQGSSHMHKQVVDWVQSNVATSQWVGAPQTGTLGYHHDRTINLDGKVNPDALRAIIKTGTVLEYARNSRIDFIADWVGMADWVKIKTNPQFSKEFEVVVRNEELNLGVLRRIRLASE